MDWSSTGSDQQPHVHSELVFVVYEAETGDIRHIHRAFALARGPKPSADAEAANALELARRHGHTSGNLRVLQTDPAAPDPGAAWRVDPDRKEIIYDDPGLSKDGQRSR